MVAQLLIFLKTTSSRARAQYSQDVLNKLALYIVKAQAASNNLLGDFADFVDQLRQILAVSKNEEAWFFTKSKTVRTTGQSPEKKKAILELLQFAAKEVQEKVNADPDAIIAYVLANSIKPEVLIKAAWQKDPAAIEASGEFLLSFTTETEEHVQTI